MTRLIRRPAVAVVAATISTVLYAAPPSFWTVSTQADFLKGTVDGLSVDAAGRLRLGPDVERLADPDAPFVWSLAPFGDAWLAGTGNDGKVLRFASDGAMSVAFDAQELGVHALVADGRGGFFAATGPDGRVHHVPATGAPTIAFDPEDRYIWSMARAENGSLYVGTGEHGVIYRGQPGGAFEPFYRTRAANVIALAIGPDGYLYAGTSTPGRLFRIDTSGRAFVVLDSPHQEVRGLRFDDSGTLWVAALTPASDEDTSSSDPVATVTAQVAGVSVGQADVTSSGASSDSRRTGRGAVYRVSGTTADLVWETGVETPYDLLPSPDGRSLLVATGGQGRLYELDTSATPVTVALIGRLEARQITQLGRSAQGQVVLAGSNPGRLFRLRTDSATSGTFDSQVRDAGSAARWGAIRWRTRGAGITIRTRTGNTSRPDDTWSEWSEPYREPAGSPITSPAARYIQWRAELRGERGRADAPELTSVTVAYLPRNLRPVVSDITVQPPGVVFQRPFSSSETDIAGFDGTAAATEPDVQGPDTPQAAPGRRMYRKGLQTLQWRAEDANGDRLTYTVSYRREGETSWRVLREGLTDTIHVWDTTSVPDGRYVVRVTATDRPSNAPDDALEGTRESDSFDVDNSPPVILVDPAGSNASIVTVTVRDAQSGVQRVEYALGGERWQVVYPVDGLSDSREERFRIELPTAADRARLIIRATDVLQNIATRGDIR